MAEPHASIIINNYNYGRYLGEAIDSALAQTYRNTEVIVVDDGSTDDSRQVIERFGDRIVPVFKDNGGQGSAYNAGFSASRGDATCFLDADDTLFPQAIEWAMELMRSGGPAKVQWPLAMTDAAGRPTGELSTKWVPPQGDLSQMVMRDGPFYDFYLHTGALYPRWFIERVFPVPEPEYRNGADIYFVTLAPIWGNVLNVGEPMGTYRFHGLNNYRGRALTDERIRQYIRRFEINCEALAKQLRLQGRRPDVAGWKQRNFNYLWPSRLLQAKRDIETFIPEGAAYLLVNGDEWGEGQPVPARRAIPFVERDGVYAGPPVDNAHAIDELERLRACGTEFLVIWWTAFWYLEYYSGWAAHLRSHYALRVQSDHIMVYDLQTSASDQ